jgi:phosphoglycolate phosphatase
MKQKFDYKHIIWDWNGTLFNDSRLCIEILNGLLIKHKKPPITLKFYQETFNFPVKNYYEKIGFSLESFKSVADEFIFEYETRKINCSLQEGARQLLYFIDNKGISQSVLSAYKQSPLEKIISVFLLNSLFIKIKGNDNHYAAGKIEIGKEHINELKFQKNQIVIIGDTVHDYEVAKEIGIDCILIPSGHQTKARLNATGALVLESLRDIKNIIK